MITSTGSPLQRHVSVPLQLLVDAQQKGYRKKLQLFLLLKLLYPSGKIKIRIQDLQFVELVDQIRSRKTTINYLRFLLNKGWLVYNSRTGYFILKSFDRIGKELHNYYHPQNLR